MFVIRQSARKEKSFGFLFCADGQMLGIWEVQNFQKRLMRCFLIIAEIWKEFLMNGIRDAIM